MILTTTNSIEGHKIIDYLGIITGTDVNRAYTNKNMAFKDSFSHKKYEEVMKNQINETKETAFQQLKENAKKLDANAIIGITVDVEVTSGLKVIISVVGTAVKVKV
jgi:uncharacterized protein YbjQ (UPF0145 family)